MPQGDWLSQQIAKQKAASKGDWLGNAIAKASQPSALEQATTGTLPYWKDLGRAAVETTAGNVLDLASTLGRKVGLTSAADNLQKQHQQMTQAIGGYETPIGLVGHLAGNVAGSIATGGALGAAQTAQAAVDPQFSTARFASYLTKKFASKDNKAAQAAADALDQIAQSDVGRPIFEAVLNILPVAAIERYRSIRDARLQSQPVTKTAPFPIESGPPGPEQGMARGALPASQAVTDPRRMLSAGQAPVQGPAILMPGDTPTKQMIRSTPDVAPGVIRQGKLLASGSAPQVEGVRTYPIEPATVGKGKNRMPLTDVVAEQMRQNPADVQAVLPQGEQGINAESLSPIEQIRAAQRARATAESSNRVYGQPDAQTADALAAAAEKAQAARKSPGGLYLYANPFLNPQVLGKAVGEVARSGPVALGAAGGAIGAMTNKEDRTRGFLIGAATGMTAGVLLRSGAAYLNARSVKDMDLSGLSPVEQATAKQFAGSVDMTGELEKSMTRQEAGGFATRLRRFADNASDATRPIERFSAKAEQAGLPASKAPAYQLNRALDTRNQIERILFEGVPDRQGNIIAPSFTQVHDGLTGNPGATKQAWNTLLLQRMVGRGPEAYGGNTALFNEHQQLLNRYLQNPVNATFVQQFKQHVDGVTKYIVDSGLWTPAEAQAIVNSDVIYTPMRNLEKAVKQAVGSGIGRGKGLNPAKGVKTFTGVGDQQAIRNPVSSYVEWMARMVDRANQASLNKSIFDAADQMGLAGEAIVTRNTQAVSRYGIPQGIEAAQHALQAAGIAPEQAVAMADLMTPGLSKFSNVITAVDDNGKRIVGVLQSPDLRDALQALRASGASDLRPITAIMGIGSRAFTVAHTGLNASFFAGKNLLMDVPTAIAQNKGVRPKDLALGFGAGMREAIYEHLKQVAPQFADMVGSSKLAEDARAFGLSNNSMFSAPVTGPRIARTIAPTTPGQAAGGVAQTALSEPLRAAETLAGGLQRGPALAVFNATKRDLLKMGWTVSDAGAKAASVAGRSVVDYRRPLGFQTLRTVASVTPYLRAALLSSGRAASFAKREPARAAVTAGVISLLSAIEWMHRQGDQELMDRPGNERAQGFEFRLPNGQVAQITLNPEWGTIRVATLAALNQLSKDDPNTAQLISAGIERALPPILNDLYNTGDPRSFIPAGGPREVVEAFTNSRVFDQKPIESDYMRENLPPWERRFDTTPAIADAGASALRRLGFDQASPARVGHVVQSMMGGYAPLVTTIADAAIGKPALRAMGDPVPHSPPESLSGSPLSPLYAIVRPEVPFRTESQTKFDKLSKNVTAAETQLRTALKRAEDQPDNEEAQRRLSILVEKYGPLLKDGASQAIKDTKDAIAQTFDEETAIRDAFAQKQLSSEDARQQLLRVRKLRQSIYRVGLQDLQSAGIH